MSNSFRVERDMLGSLQVPVDAYYGVHSARSQRNFPLSERLTSLSLVYALVQVKQACCLANSSLDYISAEQSKAILTACDEILSGKLDSEFITDALQGGAGTSLNMNVNEVIANRALELLGHQKGEYKYLHPLDQVNLHQSTNDVCPSALKLAAIKKLRQLSTVHKETISGFKKLAADFADILKIGRTQLQFAVPMTLGSEFAAYAEAFERDALRLQKCEKALYAINLGGTATGTGITAPLDYINLVIEKLAEVSEIPLKRGENCIDCTTNQDSFAEVAALLSVIAVNFQKICRDMRLLHTLEEISLAPRQAGSSIMPGKVNPVMIESLLQGALQVRASMFIIEDCASSGSLQINEFMPLISDALLTGIKLLTNMCTMLSDTLSDIKAREDICRERFEQSPLLITAFIPHIGYEKSLELLEEFKKSDSKTMKSFLTKKLDPELVEKVLSIENLIVL